MSDDDIRIDADVPDAIVGERPELPAADSADSSVAGGGGRVDAGAGSAATPSIGGAGGKLIGDALKALMSRPRDAAPPPRRDVPPVVNTVASEPDGLIVVINRLLDRIDELTDRLLDGPK